MLTTDQINTIHRLHLIEKWTVRQIAKQLHIGRRTVAKYLVQPAQTPSQPHRASKLDRFKPAIDDWLDQDSAITATVILQRLRDLGFDGGYTIVKDHLQQLRTEKKARRAFVRMEPAAGERFEIDWAHFGALVYDGAPRKLYAFALVECHSRKLYVEFTHSQTFETFLRCHIHAFDAMGGVARELWYDNLATVVAEHEGRLVRFNPRFLAFAREYNFIPRACHVAAAWEKGKIERAIGYLRQNFWSLRQFTDLPDVNSQVHHWLKTVANRRRHRETNDIPEERFRPECLKTLPGIAPDYRDSVQALVHKDLRLSFDGNRYCVPPRYVGRRLTLKADSSSLTLYDQHLEIVRYPRCWARGQTFGAERFQKELFAQMAAAEQQASQSRLVALLGPAAEEYLGRLARTDRSLTRQVRELLSLTRDYGPHAVAAAIAKAHAAGAFGSDYVANILRQQQSRRDVQPPLELKNPALNQLATDPLSLAAYDAFILRSQKEESCESTRTETQPTEPDDDLPESRADSQ
jgi:transposase